eukprot:COSAG06_NODE_1262_length_10069_cov_2.923972_7_plen_40_part_00
MPRTKRKEFLYFEWRTATLMAVRINQVSKRLLFAPFDCY